MEFIAATITKGILSLYVFYEGSEGGFLAASPENTRVFY